MEYYTELGDVALSNMYMYIFSSSSRFGSAVFIGQIEAYGDDYLLYEEKTDGTVDKNFASLVKNIVNMSDDSANSSLSTNEKIVSNYLTGKTIIFMGDSYTNGASSQFSTLCQKYGATADNRGIVSSSITGDDTGLHGYQPMWSRTDSLCQEYIDADTTANVGAIVFMGGANDGIGSTSWLGTGINDLDTNHIYGAMHSILGKFRETFDVPIFVILQPTFPNGSTSNQGCDDETAQLWGFDNAVQCESFNSDMWSQYCQYKKQSIVKMISEFYNCQIVDCFFDYDISIFSPTERAKYWSSDGHPTSNGYQHITDRLEKKILEYYSNK